MILYKCQCGEQLLASENTEKSRNEKRAWKETHRSTKEKLNPGHGYQRLVVKKKKHEEV